MNKFLALGTLVMLAACSHDNNVTGIAADRAVDVGVSAPPVAAAADAPGAVFALTNQVAGNSVATFARAADGSLTWAGSVATGGTGAGSGLGSQGALALSDDGRWLFAVNAGSNDISAFRVSPRGLRLTSRVASGWGWAISVTVHGDLAFVLNPRVDGNM